MEISLFIDGKMYDNCTVDAWQTVWEKICKMSYEGTEICEEMVTVPGILHINGKILRDTRESTHSNEYRRLEPVNTYFLTLDNMWKQYSHLYGSAKLKVVPEFKKLVVPQALFECLGVQQWFRYSFPNCKVYYWKN